MSAQLRENKFSDPGLIFTVISKNIYIQKIISLQQCQERPNLPHIIPNVKLSIENLNLKDAEGHFPDLSAFFPLGL